MAEETTRNDPPSLTRPRTFTILDMMVGVVVAGLAFLVIRTQDWDIQRFWPPRAYVTFFAIYQVANLALMALTLTLAASLLQRRREPLRVLLRRPGPAACLAALAGIGVMGVRMAVKNAAMLAYILPEEPLGGSFVHWMLSDFVRIGYAVVGAWIALILIHGWRRERSAVGWICQLVGWGWVALAFLPALRPWIDSFLPAN